MAEIDHIVIGARTLEEGAAYVEAHLGVRPQAGGRHDGVGTHNMLLGLGSQCYLEVIAKDPAQPEPAHTRPFDLDDPSMVQMLEAGPRLVAWVARTPVLDAVVTRLGVHHAGEIRPMNRGKLSWRMAMPPQNQDMGNLIPALIQWDDGKGAAPRLHDSHVRLTALEAEHPEVDALRNALAQRGLDEALRLRRSPHSRLLARFTRADGKEAVLTSG
ncbi:VOC family protein [Falsiroseomonas sp. HW251]|uniref:VOC family protein n=1 Tax=Falsiroseomonas sp. HW251 TaxID=3390998 RepID=UPI003D312A0B